MKQLKVLSFVFSFLLLGFLTSCEQDNMGVEYKDTKGYTFSNSTLNSVTVQPNSPEFTVDLYRSNALEALTGNVSVTATRVDDTKVPFEGVTAGGFSFAAGETKTTFVVNVEPLPIGIEINVALTFSEDLVSIDGVNSTVVKVNKDYNWISLGKGKYIDNWSSGVEYSVEINKAEGFDRYRAMAPYVESLKNDDGEWEDWIAASSAPFVEFWTEKDDLVTFAPFFMGLNYQADTKQPIFANHPSRFQNQSPNFNKWLDDKRVQLAPYYYIEDVGGWNESQANNVIIITLP